MIVSHQGSSLCFFASVFTMPQLEERNSDQDHGSGSETQDGTVQETAPSPPPSTTNSLPDSVSQARALSENAPEVSDGQSETEADETAEETTETDQNQKKNQPETEDIPAKLNALHQDNLASALQKAQRMLSFAIEKGIELDPEVSVSTNRAIRAFGTNAWSDEIEDNFYTSYGQLSRDLGEVNSETIAWSREKGSWLTGLIAFLGIVALALLVYLQYRVIYLHDSSSQYEETQKELIAAVDRLELVDLTLKSLASQEEQGTQANLSQEEKDNLYGEQATLNNQITLLKTRQQVQYTRLSDLVTGLDGESAPAKPWFLSLRSDEVAKNYQAELVAWKLRDEAQTPLQLEYGAQQAISQLRLLNDYFLPAIYGILGTIAFILRQFSIRLRAQSLDLGIFLNYLVRLPLGALSGIAVGLILRSDVPTGGLEDLSPFALAFIAGYSVELVFAAMDRLVAAFSSEQGQKT